MNKKSVRWSLASLLVLAAVVLSSCGTPATTTVPTATQAPVVAVATPAAAVPNCGTDPIVMKVVFETGWDMPTRLT